MAIEIREADYSDAAHRAAIVDVLDSYASDPVGGGRPLEAEVRERLVPALREHPTALVLLAFQARRAVGIIVGFFGFSTFQARPLLNLHDIAVIPERRGQGVGRQQRAQDEEHPWRELLNHRSSPRCASATASR